MAGKIKGITIEFQGDTKKLENSIRDLDKNTKNIDKELKQVNNDLKFNPGNLDLLRQKSALLGEKIGDTEEKLKLLRQEQARLDSDNVDQNTAEYRKLQREIIESESKLKTFTAQQKQANAQLSKMGQFSSKMQGLGNSLQSAGQAMQGLSIAAAAVVASMGAVTVKAGKNADDLNTMAKVYGISTQELQKYSLAAEQVDVSTEAVAKSHIRLEKQMYAAQNGTKTATQAFEKLGVKVTDANGNLRDGDDVWTETIRKLGNMKNETERDAIAMQLMGKSAAELNPLIKDGGDTYERMGELFAKYDLDYVDQETLDRANELNDSLDDIKSISQLTITTVGANLSAVLAPVLEAVVDIVGKIAGWIANLNPKVLAAVGIIASLIAVVSPLLIGLGQIAFAISSISGLMATAGISLAAIAGPIGIAIVAIGALVAAGAYLYKNWDTIKAKAQALRDKISTVWDGIKTKTQSVFQAVRNAITNPITTAVNVVRNAIQKLRNIINNAKLQLPHFKLPHFVISGGKLPWGVGGKGEAPTIDVKWYARGGIFNKGAQVIGIGENGPEAAIPLQGQYMRPFAQAIAQELSSVMSGNMATIAALSSQSGGVYEIHNVIELGGTRVAEQIYKLSKQGRQIMEG